MRRTIRSILCSISLLAFVPSLAHAQVATGAPPFGSFGGGPDIVNLANLNSHITVPVVRKAGRGGFNFTYDLSYDTSVWFPVGASGSQTWQPVYNWGRRAQTEAGTGYVSYAMLTLPCTPITNPPHGTRTMVFGYTYHDPWGIPHHFLGESNSYVGTCNGGTNNGISETATDGSGFTLNAFLTSGTVTSSTGRVLTPPFGSGVGAATGIDRNGNQISVTSAGVFTDTLGTTALTVAGQAPTSTTFTYTAPNGQPAPYTMSYITRTVKTNFGCSGVAEYGPTSNSLVDRITLPDGSFYQFNYEPTPGFTGDYTGRLASVTLPTGGTITYTYTGGSSGHITCSDGSTSGLTRQTPDGIWTYARTMGSGAASTTTITDPQGNVTQIQFQGIYETERKAYQGPATGTPLLTTDTCYNGAASPCTTTAIGLPITQRSVISALPSNQQSKHVDFYNAYGLPIENDDYDYGSGAPQSTPLRKIIIAYATLGNNINAFRQTVTICNGNGTSSSCTGPSGSSTGTVVSQTTNNYDETTPTATSGTPQHVAVSGSRGNLTSINYPVGGLTAHSTYYDTGTLNTSTDVNGAVTTFNYSSGSCGNSFPTSINEPLSMTRSMAWNCNGGVQSSVTDENGKVTTTAWADPDFWRPASATDPTNATVNFTYNGQTSAEASLNFNSGNSTADSLATVDSLGRIHVQQARQAPGSANFDSVEQDYDTLGRPSRATLPYAGTAGQTNSSAPSTTTTFDALGRPTLVSDAGGGFVAYSYSQNDVFVTIGPNPSGENTKRRQLEYDALGRLTSVCEVTAGTTAWPGGNCAQTTAQTGYWTKYAHDALGNLTGVTQNAQAASGSQQTRGYSYDGLSRLTMETNPESGATSYTFDVTPSGCYAAGTPSAGDLTSRLDAAGNLVCNFYDALHRLTSIGTSTSGCRRYWYDSATVNGVVMANTKGRLAEESTDNCSVWPPVKIVDVGFSYTARGEVSDVYQSSPHSGGYYHSAATYWPNGVLSLLTASTSYQAGWNVDGEGRSYSNYSTLGNPLSSTTYNAASQPTQVNFASGDNDSFAYDPNTSRMTQYKFNVNGSSLTGVLGWNSDGTLATQNITDAFNSANTQNCSYGYDDVARLTGANCGSAAAQTFTYDPFGNIDKSGSPYSFQPTYSSSTNRMTNIAGFVPSYDANGNVLNDPLHTYSWDAYGNPTTVDGVALTYDALGRVVEQNRSGTYTQFLYSPTGFKMVIMNGQTPQKSFTPLAGGANAVYTSTGFTYIHADWLGSSRLGSTPSRTTYFDVAYAPFGETYASSGSADPAFTSQRQDTVSGLYDFPAREYSIQGRWPSPDPAGLAAVDPGNPQSWNRYAYVGNNPLNYIDPSGLGGICLAFLYDGGCGSGPGGYGGPGSMTCYQDSVVTDCGQVLNNINLGTAAQCPNNDCTGIKAGQGPAGTTVFQQWIPGGQVSSRTGIFQADGTPAYGDASAGQIIPGHWETIGTSSGNDLWFFPLLGMAGGGNSTGGGTVRAAPKLKFKPPSLQNFTHEFLPCYGAQLIGNFFTGDGLVGTAAAIALTVTKRAVGVPVLLVWTGINAYRAGAACAIASRGYYE